MGMIERLREYLNNTPKEVIKNDWKEVEEFSNIGPSAKSFIKHMGVFYPDDLPNLLKRPIEEEKYFTGKLETPKFGVFFYI